MSYFEGVKTIWQQIHIHVSPFYAQGWNLCGLMGEDSKNSEKREMDWITPRKQTLFWRSKYPPDFLTQKVFWGQKNCFKPKTLLSPKFFFLLNIFLLQRIFFYSRTFRSTKFFWNQKTMWGRIFFWHRKYFSPTPPTDFF